jgi:hypothetical protein
MALLSLLSALSYIVILTPAPTGRNVWRERSGRIEERKLKSQAKPL